MEWRDHFNVAELPQGSYRSIAGYAAESLVIGRAMQCGYNLFFKAWRDSPYDGVLDHNGVLFRIEIKGTTVSSLGVTAGGRSGAQINREAEDRTHIIDSDEVDLLVGVNNLNGDCYLIPSEILSIFNQQALSLEKIELFKEKWKILGGYSGDCISFSTEDIKRGFSRRSEDELVHICHLLNIEIKEDQETYSIEWPGFRGGFLNGLTFRKIASLLIWKAIF